MSTAEPASEDSDNPADCVTYAEAAKVFGIPERRLKWAAHATRIQEYSRSEPWPGKPFSKLTFLVSLSEARAYLQSIGAIGNDRQRQSGDGLPQADDSGAVERSAEFDL